jgi:hypothetical protein
MNSRIDVLIGAGLIAVLAVKAPLVVVGGLLCLWWTTRRRGRDLRPEEAARAAMAGGFFLPGVLFALGLVAMTFAFGGSSFAGFMSEFINRDAQLTSLTLFGFGFMALVASFLLGLAVKLVSPWLLR